MNIKVLGSGCANCKKLLENVKEAVQSLQKDATVDYIQDWKEIATYGLLRTPGLIVDQKIVSYGRVPTVEEIKNWIK
ncbi:MAG: thioredoxin family protein [Bacilli bacterium]|jgi:small redox-active disulfide protein 2|nr:thioredoxin family protein [Bacilli bacterium]MDY0063872.1 thioredoxin family protein [Bacilli bacterium]